VHAAALADARPRVDPGYADELAAIVEARGKFFNQLTSSPALEVRAPAPGGTEQRATWGAWPLQQRAPAGRRGGAGARPHAPPSNPARLPAHSDAVSPLDTPPPLAPTPPPPRPPRSTASCRRSLRAS
jgi:hypothetical protein